MKRRFGTWTSANENLDQLIRDTQLTAQHNEGYLEFIPFSDLEMVLYEREGRCNSLSTQQFGSKSLLGLER